MRVSVGSKGDADTTGGMTTEGAAPTETGPGESTTRTDGRASSTSAAVSSNTPTGAAVTNGFGGAVAVAMGVLGVVLL